MEVLPAERSRDLVDGLPRLGALVGDGVLEEWEERAQTTQRLLRVARQLRHCARAQKHTHIKHGVVTEQRHTSEH